MSQPRPFFIASDHAGFPLKQAIVEALSKQSDHYALQDLGCFDAETPVSYPSIAAQLAMAMEDQPEALGILTCGSGVGVAVAANRFPWIRAVQAHDVTLAQLSREHNDCNVLCMGARFIAPAYGLRITEAWLASSFEAGRHRPRVDELGQLPKSLHRVGS